MKRVPASIIGLPNGAPMNLDRHNMVHRRGAGRSGPYITHCDLQAQPVTLAQAIAWGDGWCGRCFEQPRAHGGRP